MLAFVLGVLWMVAASAAAASSAEGIAVRFDWLAVQPLLRQAFFVLLLVVGFAALGRLTGTPAPMGETNALPRRETEGREFRLGAAMGWAMLLAVVLPLMLLRSLHPVFWWAGRAWFLTAISLGTMAFGTLALELAFRGFLFRQLIAVLGQVAATVLLAVAYTVAISLRGALPGFLELAAIFAMALVFALAYLRTHALWLGWGLHFAWAAAMGVVFGLPVAAQGLYSTVVTTYSSGPEWLTGGDFGPDGSALTLLVALASMPLLFRVTRDFAWAYTHPVIVPGGYPMEAAPPAAHVAMQNSVAPPAPPPLVQILSTTSTNASTMPAVNEHLQREPESTETEP